MSSFKRRHITKGDCQSHINFPHQKGNQPQPHKTKDYTKGNQGEIYEFEMKNGANECSTPYRSANRIKDLLKYSLYQPINGRVQLKETPSNNFFKLVDTFRDDSKPSSATTACTYIPNDLSAFKTVNITDNKKKRDLKRESKNDSSDDILGTKRPGQQKIDEMEYFLRLNSRAAKFVVQKLKLKDRKTGNTFDFPIILEDQLDGFKCNPIIQNYDMSKLEIEYDYDTDDEQMSHSKKMLLHELFQAIEFFIKEDPIKLVDNVTLITQ